MNRSIVRNHIRDTIGTSGSKSATKIMLLGSGELGKEIALEAHKLGVEVIAIDRYANAPAMHVASKSYVIDMLDKDSIVKVARSEGPDAIIPEIEAINTEALMELEEEGYRITPNAKAVKIAMNRIDLREYISKKLNLPTTSYGVASNYYEAREICEKIGYPCIIKPEMSSSGHGHIVVREPIPEQRFREIYEYSISHSRGSSRRVIVEEYVDLETELTVLALRYVNADLDIETVALEPIEHWRYGEFHYIESWQPSTRSRKELDQAKSYAEKIASSLGGLGVYGVEIFITRKGDILVSEVAPRPHDTGLVTIASQNLSEFALHLRAALNLPIPSIKIVSPAASHAIYTDHENLDSPRYRGLSRVLAIDDLELRIFGKPKTYRGRRMAVAIARGSSIEEARRKARAAAEALKITP